MKSKNEEKLVMLINGMLVEVLLISETSQIAHQAPSLVNCVKSSQR
jgi:hypothetical protein